jgi:hypothetical protein
MNVSKRIRLAGTVVLLAGLLAAAIIYATAKPDEILGILGVDVRTNRDTLELEKMGGKSYVMLQDFLEWFSGLWHGQKLAYTIAVLSISGFLFSRWLAGFLADAPVVEEAAGPKA